MNSMSFNMLNHTTPTHNIKKLTTTTNTSHWLVHTPSNGKIPTLFNITSSTVTTVTVVLTIQGRSNVSTTSKLHSICLPYVSVTSPSTFCKHIFIFSHSTHN